MGVSGMFVGTVMMREERAYVFTQEFGIQKTSFKVQNKMCFADGGNSKNNRIKL